MSAAELASTARNIADTAHDAACNGPAEGYPSTLAQVAIAYAVLAAVEQLSEIAEAQRQTANLLNQAQVMA